MAYSIGVTWPYPKILELPEKHAKDKDKLVRLTWLAKLCKGNRVELLKVAYSIGVTWPYPKILELQEKTC